MKKIIICILLLVFLIYNVLLEIRLNKLEKTIQIQNNQIKEINYKSIGLNDINQEEIDAGDVSYNIRKFRYPRNSVGEALHNLNGRVEDIENALNK